ncbi:MAG: molecular chaperone HtpG [Oscillospiraceae bacterium]|jgi:molecular chaperone HtpG|nr:molecular chaperone HtpG [Oscillospiraceae bacterium]
MPKKQFKSESKRLLDLMINSIYTHREIFLRELISNASDAIDKLCYIALTDEGVGLSRDDFCIEISADKEKRTLTLRDNGIGMTAQEMENNLGVIAKSGSLKFKQEHTDAPDDIDIIGQFGVGFYSAFMVSSRVTVTSRAYGEPRANVWVSEGSDGYTITECGAERAGTEIILELKPDTDDDNFSEYLEEYTLHSLVKKYSDYIRWPIVMDVTRSRKIEGAPDESGKPAISWEDYTERETINSRVPLWQRPKSELTEERMNEFFKTEFGEDDDPAAAIRVDAEGAASYRALLFIPSKAPYDYYSREYEPGLKLYASGVMIMEKCAALLPDYFRFVRGVVDSQDLSLNISRETLQQDRALRVIAANLEKKTKAELLRLQEAEPEKYAAFYRAFALQLKHGMLGGYGENRDKLRDLLMFYSAGEEKLITLEEYAKKMPQGQPYIYYACGESAAALAKLPQCAAVTARGYDVLYLTDDVDEFVANLIGKQGEIELRSVRAEDLGLTTAEEKKAIEQSEEVYREVLDFVKESLDGKIAAARFSRNALSAPAALTAQGAVTLEMEKYFAAMGGDAAPRVKAERVLELSEAHPAFTALRAAHAQDRDKAARYAKILYNLALLGAGLSPDDPAALTELVAGLMS